MSDWFWFVPSFFSCRPHLPKVRRLQTKDTALSVWRTILQKKVYFLLRIPLLLHWDASYSLPFPRGENRTCSLSPKQTLVFVLSSNLCLVLWSSLRSACARVVPCTDRNCAFSFHSLSLPQGYFHTQCRRFVSVLRWTHPASVQKWSHWLSAQCFTHNIFHTGQSRVFPTLCAQISTLPCSVWQFPALPRVSLKYLFGAHDTVMKQTYFAAKKHFSGVMCWNHWISCAVLVQRVHWALSLSVNSKWSVCLDRQPKWVYQPKVLNCHATNLVLTTPTTYLRHQLWYQLHPSSFWPISVSIVPMNSQSFGWEKSCVIGQERRVKYIFISPTIWGSRVPMWFPIRANLPLRHSLRLGWTTMGNCVRCWQKNLLFDLLVNPAGPFLCSCQFLQLLEYRWSLLGQNWFWLQNCTLGTLNCECGMLSRYHIRRKWERLTCKNKNTTKSNTNHSETCGQALHGI